MSDKEEFADIVEELLCNEEDFIVCPYCHERSCADPEFYPDDNEEEWEHECSSCGKTFIVEFRREISHIFQTFRVKKP